MLVQYFHNQTQNIARNKSIICDVIWFVTMAYYVIFKVLFVYYTPSYALVKYEFCDESLLINLFRNFLIYDKILVIRMLCRTSCLNKSDSHQRKYIKRVKLKS